MSCDVTKFSISKGSDNTFVFTIKQDNSTLPLTIVTADTFVAKLVSLDPESVESYTFHITTPLTDTPDAVNGKISLVILTAATTGLIKEIGSKVDRYYPKPTYKLILECVTANNGEFIAKVGEVYVD